MTSLVTSPVTPSASLFAASGAATKRDLPDVTGKSAALFDFGTQPSNDNSGGSSGSSGGIGIGYA